jgi:hypothetical protein
MTVPRSPGLMRGRRTGVRCIPMAPPCTPSTADGRWCLPPCRMGCAACIWSPRHRSTALAAFRPRGVPRTRSHGACGRDHHAGSCTSGGAGDPTLRVGALRSAVPRRATGAAGPGGREACDIRSPISYSVFVLVMSRAKSCWGSPSTGEMGPVGAQTSSVWASGPLVGECAVRAMPRRDLSTMRRREGYGGCRIDLEEALPTKLIPSVASQGLCRWVGRCRRLPRQVTLTECSYEPVCAAASCRSQRAQLSSNVHYE